MKTSFLLTVFILSGIFAGAQHVGSTPEYVKMLTSKWTGERFADGRPKVPDAILDRLQTCTLEQIWGYLDTKGFNAWIKGNDPSYIKDMTPTSINAPIRVGEVTVLPGDVVFANDYGVVFIPAYLIEGLVTASEMTGLRDEFEREMLQSGKYL